MADLIDVLERLGTDARWREADRMELEGMLEPAALDRRAVDALLAGDAPALGRLLGCPVLVALQTPAEEEDEGEGDHEDEPGEFEPMQLARVS